MSNYDRLAFQVRSMKPGEWLTIDLDSVDGNQLVAPWREGHWTPCDLILEEIVGSGYEWSWERDVTKECIIFKRRDRPTEEGLRTYVSPDRAHYYKRLPSGLYQLKQ